MGTEPSYLACCSWRRSTGMVAVSADEALLGRPDHLNPQQLVVVAAASCQLVCFLAVAARARIDVLAYDDEAEGVVAEEEGPVRLTGIILRPRILVATGPTEDRVRRLVQIAQRECHVPNSPGTDIEVEPRIHFESAA